MKKIELINQNHNYTVGMRCETLEPNITEDCIFTKDGEPIGFYLHEIPEKLMKYINIANRELMSTRVPKSVMKRSSGVLQYSCILGGVPPKPNMRRGYATISSVHSHRSADLFVKAMLLAVGESEEIIKKLIPEVYKKQVKIIEEQIPEKWRFGKLFTSSISNCNISAPFHIDKGNLKDTVNVIIVKKKNATGGNTFVPDYNAVADSCDNSMLVYPAWANVHGVTPIKPTTAGGYRNSLVFYPLKAFANL